MTVFEYLESIPYDEYGKLWDMLDTNRSAATIYKWLHDHHVPACICAYLNWDMYNEYWCNNYSSKQPIYDFLESALDLGTNSSINYDEWGVDELQEYLDSKVEVISPVKIASLYPNFVKVKIGNTIFNVDADNRYFISKEPVLDGHPIPEEGSWADIGCTPRAFSKRGAVRYVYGDDPFKGNPFYK